jgi:hypothetical protein
VAALAARAARLAARGVLTVWDERYAEPGFADGEAPDDFLVEQVSRRPGG